MDESLPSWAEKNPSGEGYVVNVSDLLFSITLTELCIAGMVNNVDAEGKRTTRGELIERWKAEILNLRKCVYMTVVRANYHTFYNKAGETRETFGDRWRAAHESTKYLFTVDLEEAWKHLNSEEAS